MDKKRKLSQRLDDLILSKGFIRACVKYEIEVHEWARVIRLVRGYEAGVRRKSLYSPTKR